MTENDPLFGISMKPNTVWDYEEREQEARESPPVAVCASCAGRGWIFHDRAGMRCCPRCDGSGAP